MKILAENSSIKTSVLLKEDMVIVMEKNTSRMYPLEHFKEYSELISNSALSLLRDDNKKGEDCHGK